MRHLLPDLCFVDGTLTPGLAVSVSDGRIRAVGPAEGLRPGPDDTVERLPGRALLPGFVNAHSHAFQRGLRGHVQYGAGGDSFWTWRERMYALATSLDPEGVERVSARAFEEMLRCGFTTVGEFHYLHHAPDGAPYADPDELALRVAAAAEAVGIRLVLLRVAYARSGHGVAPNPLQRRFLDRDPSDVLAAVERLRGRGLNVGLAPHSVRACPAEWLRAFAGFDGPVHAHVDEQPAEIAASLAEHGARPLHVFAQAGLVTERFTAVHLTHPDDGEIATLREAGGRVCACPTTELDLGDGFLPAERLEGVPLCVGSDSHAQIDPFAEVRSLELLARARLGRRNVLPHPPDPDALAARLLACGTAHGADALGVDAGRIAPGRLADLVAVDLDHPALRDARPLPAIVFAGHPGVVREVWVGGRRVVG
jgi:formimidoylglutamate deiminase